MTYLEALTWLKETPPPEDISYFNEKPFIKISKVQTLLDRFENWNTDSFHFKIFPVGNFTFASGSLQLHVQFDETHYKNLSGAFTLQISAKDDNKDYEGTILSECIKNASKKLGARFGRYFNDLEDYQTIQVREVVKSKAGVIERNKYKLALDTNDLKTISELEERYTDLC